MSEIKVNTDDLRNNASTFNTEAQNLNNALSELLSVINSLDLGKYQSQLSDRVRLRVTPIQDDSLRCQGRLAELADKLNNKALAFEQANAANAADTAQLSNQMYDFTNSSAEMTASATLKKMDDPKSNRIWTYGSSLFGSIIDWFTRIFGKENSPIETLNETLYINCRLNLRQSPGLQSTIQRVLKPGETVTLESSEVFYEYPHAWVKVKDSSGEIGWIAKDVLGYQETEKNTPPVTNQNQTIEVAEFDKNNSKTEIHRLPVLVSTHSDNCWEYVHDQIGNLNLRGQSENFYNGVHKPNSPPTVILANGNEYRYDIEPKLGAVMVERPNTDADIYYGHVSYVYEVTIDTETKKIISFKVAEGNFPLGKISNNYEFLWDENKNRYSCGNRKPDGFVY